ncbi:MAG: glycosyltransferase [Elusimicrobiales bacterium]|nr:glycosyltransferase [Elusimicrobiales bacterium]
MPETKPRLLFYTDCPFFAGCENMVAGLLNSAEIKRDFETLLVYRGCRKYEEGAAARLEGGVQREPALVFFADDLAAALGPLGKVMRALGLVTALKYFFALLALPVLFFKFRRFRPDIVHINDGGYPGAYSCLTAVFAARLAGARAVVFVVNNIAVPYDRLSRRLERPLDRAVAVRVSVFVTGSAYAGEKLAATLQLPPGKARSMPNGVAPRALKDAPAAVRERLGVPAGAVVIGNVALLDPRKGHRYLVEALAAARARLPGVKLALLIEGLGPERAALEELAAGLGVGGEVKFLGRQENIFDLMNAFDIFALSSTGMEDFPNVVLEAMSLGKPVIGTRVAGVPEQIEDGSTGLLVPPGDAEALGAAIADLAANPGRREALGLAGKARFEAEFTCGRAAERYRELYRGLLAA